MKWNKNIWNDAISLLVLTSKHETHGVEFYIADKTTNSFEKFKQETLDSGGIITISREGSETTIFDSQERCFMHRLHHDVIHINLDADFSFEGEKQCLIEHLKHIESYGKLMNLDEDIIDLAMNIQYVDLVSQYRYYEKYNLFVENQKAFVINEIYNKNRSFMSFSEFTKDKK